MTERSFPTPDPGAPDPSRATAAGHRVFTGKRRVFLFGDINAGVAERVVDQLISFAEGDPGDSIDLLINSTGGDIEAACAIINAMHGIPCRVNTICMGFAQSAACIILMAGTGVRSAFENSVLLIHRMVWDEPPEQDDEQGDYMPPPDEKYVELCRRLENAYLGRFLNHDAVWAERRIPTALDMSTDDALQLGVIDGVIFLDRD
ncbi:MAG: ATP-dependent Clp protease proteolytic subunit [Planctomycetes bacterium]|nr:ATP-dependent Clp protease proteolytic subunit [Planctomycetota bacterium]